MHEKGQTSQESEAWQPQEKVKYSNECVMRTYVLDFLTKDDYHIETKAMDFECLALVMDYCRIKIGTIHSNGSIIGKVKIHQDGDETEDDCIVINDK